jgi:signal transduction histidine kinase
MAHEIEQLLREAIANAVRHGQAAAIDVELRNGHDTLTLRVCDNGRGFAPDAPQHAPRSISERVRALGGSLTVDTGDKGTQLLITLPVEDTR